MKTQDKASQAATSPQAALEILKEGNARFVKRAMLDRDLPAQVEATATGQYPLAVVLGCIDSRVPAELVFDQGIGDIFNVRVAGNCVNEDVLGSMEFSCKVAGSKLVVVLGHTSCGAVKGACDQVELGNLTALLSKIQPAVAATAEPADQSQRTSKNGEFVQAVVENNVRHALSELRKRSPVLVEMETAGEIAIVGAMYDVATGVVNFELV